MVYIKPLYIDAHQLKFQERPTRVSAYCSMLSGNFLETVCKQYYEEFSNDTLAILDICDLHDLYSRICEILGGEDAMESLNLLFHQRFLIVTAINVFLQGMTNQLLYSLTYRDMETSKQVFQLLLDEPIPMTDEDRNEAIKERMASSLNLSVIFHSLICGALMRNL